MASACQHLLQWRNLQSEHATTGGRLLIFKCIFFIPSRLLTHERDAFPSAPQYDTSSSLIPTFFSKPSSLPARYPHFSPEPRPLLTGRILKLFIDTQAAQTTHLVQLSPYLQVCENICLGCTFKTPTLDTSLSTTYLFASFSKHFVYSLLSVSVSDSSTKTVHLSINGHF